jgi:alpha-1,6-mannosyltransferase
MIASSTTAIARAAVDKSDATGVAVRWFLGGLLAIAFGVALTLFSPRFGYAYEVGAMPVLWLAAGLVLAGLVYCLCLPQLIADSLSCDPREVRLIVAGMVAAGLAARLVLFTSEPILEDDYQRYLWDGAVTASGGNPYALSPKEALAQGGGLCELAREGGEIVRRINHPELRTVYPPVTQAAFALAHLIGPWSLTAWRSVILLFDLATLALVLLLLREAGRSPLWSALYWWNPIVIKELLNSAHMEAVVLPFVLLALWLSLRRRPLASVSSLAFAVGTKLWPMLLLPLLVRWYGQADRRMFVNAAVLFAAIVAALAIPLWLDGLDRQSGSAAYFSSWQTGSALFPVLERAVAMPLSWLALPSEMAGLVARGIIALWLAVIALRVSLRPVENADDLLGRASLVVAAVILLSPAQFPWYAVWFAPFLAFRPWAGFLLLAATLPLYYLDFYFIGRGQPEIFTDAIVWIIWVPVWAALAFEALRERNRAFAG